MSYPLDPAAPSPPGKQLFFNSVRLVVPEVGVGTGFLVDYRWDGGEEIVLVTCRHVVDGGKQLHTSFIAQDRDEPTTLNTVTVNHYEALENWTFHPTEDVAIAPFGHVYAQLNEQQQRPMIRLFRHTMIPADDSEVGNDLDAIEPVVFVGYPAGLRDETNYLPIARTGTTATPAYVNFEGAPQFLIDASVFPGSSGSPVVLMNRGGYAGRKGEWIAGNRIKLLGILKGRYQEPDSEESMDLGVVVKSRVILEAIEVRMIKDGLVPPGGTKSDPPVNPGT